MTEHSHLHWQLKAEGFFTHNYLRKGVGCIGSCCSEGGEESGSAGSFDCVNHSLLWPTQMRGLSERTDEHKYIIHS